MIENSLVWVIFASLCAGAGGFGLRMWIARRKVASVETKIRQLHEEFESERKTLRAQAESEADTIRDKARKEASEIRESSVLLEKSTLKREQELDTRIQELKEERDTLREKAQKVKYLYQEAEALRQSQLQKLEEIAGLDTTEAKRILMDKSEDIHQTELVEQMNRLETIRVDQLENKAKNIMVLAMQKYAQDQASEMTTSTVALPDEDVKGKIIGKEGRNIRTLENSTGVQIIIDDTPDNIVLSCFDPIRRSIAKLAIEKLIEDGRIQPARIEEFVAEARESIQQKIKEAGEAALYDTGITGIDPKLTYILGRLRFRTSYGQNVLMHSVEVSHLAGAIAAELGANVMIAKMGGLFHDVGKALDHEVEGTHVEIGRTLLKKYNVKEDVIKAMQSHHEEYPYETIESRIVQVADALSASRPGARRDSVDNYIKRLGELEAVSNSFDGVERSYAINAGREIRVFVTPYKISDLQAKKLARTIAMRIEEDLQYPGEIKVTLIRETRIIDYAR